MTLHKFAIGDRVQVNLDVSVGGRQPDLYTISRLLPIEAKVCQYRVKREHDGLERRVGEDQLIREGTGEALEVTCQSAASA